VAHPPGFPLYLVLAHRATLVPISSVAVRVNFASALFAAFAVSAMVLMIAEAMHERARPVLNRPAANRERGRKSPDTSIDNNRTPQHGPYG